jgi:hypothetical protein
MNFANWRTSTFGAIATVAAFLTQFPELLSGFLDPAVAKKVAAVAAAVSAFIAFAQAKDRQVVGNGTINEPHKVAQSDGTNKVINPVAVALLLPALFFNGCATNTGDPAKDARGRAVNQALVEAGQVLGSVAVSTLMNAAQQEMTSSSVDWGHAATQGVFANSTSIFNSGQVDRVVMAFSGSNLPQTAQAASAAFASSAAPAQDKANAIAAVISTAAGKPISTFDVISTSDSKAVKPLGKRSEVGGQRSAIALRGSVLDSGLSLGGHGKVPHPMFHTSESRVVLRDLESGGRALVIAQTVAQ